MRFSITLRWAAHDLGDGVHNVQWQLFYFCGELPAVMACGWCIFNEKIDN